MDNLKAFLLFVSIVLLVYGGTNYYIYRRLMSAAALSGSNYWILKIVFLLIVLSYPLGRTLGGQNPFGQTFIWVGSFYLAVMFYGLLFALFFDILRLSDRLIGWFPTIVTSDLVRAGRISLIFSTIVIAGLITYGHINSQILRVKEFKISLPNFKPMDEQLRIAVVSDVHLGALIGEKRFNKMLSAITETNPDLILIVGDLFDEHPSHMPWVANALKRFEASRGVILAVGNHEYYSDLKAISNIVNRTGIRILRDQYEEIDGLIIAAFDDQTGNKQFSKRKVPLTEILENVDRDKPTILLHHTPTRWEEALSYGVDLAIFAHTHGGQILPLGWITKLIYGFPQGMSIRENTTFILSNGIGTWGPPVRIGANPEIVLLIVDGERKYD